MRTTIEITNEHRAKLLEIAALRGAKGFSGIVTEAIELYLAQNTNEAGRRRVANKYRGWLTEKEASELKRHVEETRKSWRT
ncbi:MAG: hypothetical protein HY286_03095 [Planctomycetes bacterium]|nr:hypothetical protein [Planctomycetota bacterium]